MAEISANHNQDFGRAMTLIQLAAEAGADSVKFQTYKPETMALPSADFAVSESHSLWGGIKLVDLYASAMTPWEWHSDLFNYARSLGLIPFSSPFDRTAVDFLENLDCPMYKIASLETGDVDLIEYVASTNKPMIISTGASTLDEIAKAVEATQGGGCRDLQLLVCTSSYPADPNESHVRRMETLRKEFEVEIGISDHTLGIGVALAAIALGASTVEKHITIRRTDGGHDAAFSMEPEEFKSLVNEGRIARASLGSAEWKIQPSEEESRRLRRSLFIVQDVRKGEIASRQNVSGLRPNLGGPIADISHILGRRFNQDYKAGMAATVDCVD